jgi:hypothetical protein
LTFVGIGAALATLASMNEAATPARHARSRKRRIGRPGVELSMIPPPVGDGC